MADISMCNDKTCPMAPRCYRSPLSGTKPSSHWQSWFEPRRDGERCDEFWERGA